MLAAMATAAMMCLAVTGCAGQSASSGAGASSPFGTTIELLGTYQTSVGPYAYVKVPRGMSSQQIISLARRLHAYQPKDTFWLLDDKSRIKQLLAALPKTAEGDYSTYPRQWFNQHCVANIELAVGAGNPYWVVLKGPSIDVTDPMAKLS
jgi:hypothetical protein